MKKHMCGSKASNCVPEEETHMVCSGAAGFSSSHTHKKYRYDDDQIDRDGARTDDEGNDDDDEGDVDKGDDDDDDGSLLNFVM